jgi:hypothetical protein
MLHTSDQFWELEPLMAQFSKNVISKTDMPHSRHLTDLPEGGLPNFRYFRLFASLGMFHVALRPQFLAVLPYESGKYRFSSRSHPMYVFMHTSEY